jgi:hypothetical protein
LAHSGWLSLGFSSKNSTTAANASLLRRDEPPLG